MPAAFDKCRSNGGKLRTISGPNKQYGLAAREYIHICILGGKEFLGEKKKKKELATRMGM